MRPTGPGASRGLAGRALVPLAGAAMACLVTSPTEDVRERPLPPTAHELGRKGGPDPSRSALLATLVDTHSPARLPLDEAVPRADRFEAVLADPVLGGVHAIDPNLLALLRSVARAHALASIELVSGFRSPKLNESLRKKGHHVASHSQHSLGHAVDFRVIPEGAAGPLDPAALAHELRELGWAGGVGVYLEPNDRFVHADTGPRRTWLGR